MSEEESRMNFRAALAVLRMKPPIESEACKRALSALRLVRIDWDSTFPFPEDFPENDPMVRLKRDEEHRSYLIEIGLLPDTPTAEIRPR